MITAENVTFEYTQSDGEKNVSLKALNGVSLNIEKGDFVAVLGRNGSGKSTFARHINALLTPTAGRMLVNGIDTADEKNMLEIRKTTGMVFQNPDNQLVATVVEEEVAFAPENMGVDPAEIRRRVDFALNAVGLAEYAKSQPSKLSGGQKQRLAIAGVLAMSPQRIVLDEPTAMLDPIARREIMDILRRLNKESGVTVVLITHYMEEAALAERVIVIDKGAVKADGSPREVFSQVEKLKALGLDVPQSTEVSYRLRQKGADISLALTPTELAKEICRVTGKTFAAAETKDFAPPPRLFLGDEPNEEGLRVKGLTHIYNKGTVFEKKALDNVNLFIPKGDFVGIIGQTGSGKSTLIWHLNALLKPDEGEVLLNGKNIYADKTALKKIRQKIGVVFQYPERQLFELTVYDDAAFGVKNAGVEGDELDRRVREALSLVGIGEELYGRSPFKLSGGQKRRAAIAGVLAMRPEIIILDEPTAGLDPVGRKELLALLKNLRKTAGVTVVLVSHSMEDIAETAENIIVMSDGKAVMSGSAEQIFRAPKTIEKLGLSVPEITRCAHALKNCGFNVADGIFTTDAAIDEILRITAGDK